MFCPKPALHTLPPFVPSAGEAAGEANTEEVPKKKEHSPADSCKTAKLSASAPVYTPASPPQPQQPPQLPPPQPQPQQMMMNMNMGMQQMNPQQHQHMVMMQQQQQQQQQQRMIVGQGMMQPGPGGLMHGMLTPMYTQPGCGMLLQGEYPPRQQQPCDFAPPPLRATQVAVTGSAAELFEVDIAANLPKEQCEQLTKQTG